MRVCGAVAAGFLVACSSGSQRSGSQDAGSTDAGTTTSGPMPAPLLRMDDGNVGFTHTTEYQGVVTRHGPAMQVPSTLGNITPAAELSVEVGDGTSRDLFYTLPKPFTLSVGVNEQLHVFYRERTTGFGSSYGVYISGLLDGSLRMLAEDGAVGPAFDQPNPPTFSTPNPLGFTFERDAQALGQDSSDCGTKTHYPGIIGRGTERKRMFPGDSSTFTLADGTNVDFTLLDMYHVDDSSCGMAPDFSLAYIVKPSAK